MIHQFDHRFATFENRERVVEIRDCTNSEHQSKEFIVQPRYWIRSQEIAKAWSNDSGWSVVYRLIADATNEQTMMCAVIPKAGIGHSIGIAFDENPSARLACAFVANFNTISLDFIARRKRTNPNVSKFVVEQLPFLPQETYSDCLINLVQSRVLELVYTAEDLAPFARDLGHEGYPFSWDPARRALLRAELDGIYAHLYKLPREDFAYILDQFPLVMRNDEVAYGEYRTARLCLEAYDYYAWDAIQELHTAVTKFEVELSRLVVKRLGNALACVPESVQAAQEEERLKQRKPPRASSLEDFIGAGYLSLLPKIIKPNRETNFTDLFESNRQVDERIGPIVMLRNALAHAKEQFLPDAVRTKGELELRWFAEKLGLQLDIVSPPRI